MTTSNEAKRITTRTDGGAQRASRDDRSPSSIARVGIGVLALMLVVGATARARAASFLDEVDRGKAAVAGSGAATMNGAAARAAAVNGVVAKDAKGSAAFTIGATLAALDLDLDSEPATGKRGDRVVVERQVRDLLQAQAESKIGNRALCLLSGRANPRSLEAQIRLVDPKWSCGAHH